MKNHIYGKNKCIILGMKCAIFDLTRIVLIYNKLQIYNYNSMRHSVPCKRHSIIKTSKYILHHNVYPVYNMIVMTIIIIMECFMLEAI
jgi:hypothetical protein